ncbi:MAG TPA: ABC transporter permease [Candidatus Binatia bacterium]|nr:ABC transporter permease [Candidatus Binatia bacterium]
MRTMPAAEAAAKRAALKTSLLPGAVHRWLAGYGLEVAALIAGALVWEGLGRMLGLQWLPPFSQVVEAFVQFLQSGVILSNLRSSLTGLLLGFALSVVLGLSLGALMGRYRAVERALDIYVHALFVCPSILFAPIFFAVFGLSDASRIAIIVVYSTFVIVINTATAIRTVDPSLVEMAVSFGCRERQIFTRILLPASLPLVFAGLRLGMGRAVKGMINGEMLIAFVGLGALAQRYGAQFDAAKVFAIAMVVLIIGLVSNAIVQTLENRLTRWAG